MRKRHSLLKDTERGCSQEEQAGFQCVCVCVSRSVVSDSLRPPWAVAHQAPLSMKFSRQEYWRGFPFPTLGYFPSSGTEPKFLAPPALAGGFFTTTPPGSPLGPHQLPAIWFFYLFFPYFSNQPPLHLYSPTLPPPHLFHISYLRRRD